MIYAAIANVGSTNRVSQYRNYHRTQSPMT
jgi:hypothetical protein